MKWKYAPRPKRPGVDIDLQTSLIAEVKEKRVQLYL
jgi:hypothetical protein